MEIPLLTFTPQLLFLRTQEPAVMINQHEMFPPYTAEKQQRC